MQTVSDWSHIPFLISWPFCLIKRWFCYICTGISLFYSAQYQYNNKLYAVDKSLPPSANSLFTGLWRCENPQLTYHHRTSSNSKSVKIKTCFTPTPKNIPASSSPALIWSGCVGLSIINVPEENRRSPFTPPRLQHNNRKTTERGLSICLARLEAVVYWAADQGN